MKRPAADRKLTPTQCATVLRVLADETRLRIVESLMVNEQCVTNLVRLLRRAQPHISHHLRILRDSGLVEGRRDGRHVHYRIAPALQRRASRLNGQALNFGCCEVRFPQDVLVQVSRRAIR